MENERIELSRRLFLSRMQKNTKAWNLLVVFDCIQIAGTWEPKGDSSCCCFWGPAAEGIGQAAATSNHFEEKTFPYWLHFLLVMILGTLGFPMGNLSIFHLPWIFFVFSFAITQLNIQKGRVSDRWVMNSRIQPLKMGEWMAMTFTEVHRSVRGFGSFGRGWGSGASWFHSRVEKNVVVLSADFQTRCIELIVMKGNEQTMF